MTHTHKFDACDCTKGLYKHHKRVCTENCLWKEKNKLAASGNRTSISITPGPNFYLLELSTFSPLSPRIRFVSNEAFAVSLIPWGKACWKNSDYYQQIQINMKQSYELTDRRPSIHKPSTITAALDQIIPKAASTFSITQT